MRKAFTLLVGMMLAVPAAFGQGYRLERPGSDSSTTVMVRPQAQQPSRELGLARDLVGAFTQAPVRQQVPFNGFAQDSPMRGAAAVFSVPTVSELKRIGARDVVIVI